jgi:hypothetical protein
MQKTLPRTTVPTNCQGLLAKLLSFTTDIGQHHRGIENYLIITGKSLHSQVEHHV